VNIIYWLQLCVVVAAVQVVYMCSKKNCSLSIYIDPIDLRLVSIDSIDFPGIYGDLYNRGGCLFVYDVYRSIWIYIMTFFLADAGECRRSVRSASSSIGATVMVGTAFDLRAGPGRRRSVRQTCECSPPRRVS
jgi:hypothetical protein